MESLDAPAIPEINELRNTPQDLRGIAQAQTAAAIDAIASAELMAAVDAAIPPTPAHEYTLAISPQLLLQQIQYLSDLQKREHNELLAGVIRFLTDLGSQAYIRHGLAATPEPPAVVLARLAADIDTNTLAKAVSDSVLQLGDLVHKSTLQDQMHYLVRNFGADDVRALLLRLAAKE